ncbi:MAG: PEGA domain-containing protein [Planctomycetes bacterium]|nr:PEGA domain-containing protein [Planctomycetota bacterium]
MSKRANRVNGWWMAWLALVAAFVLPGCVEREMVITSDPPGVDVWVNEQWHGTTPYRLPFKHYGVFSVRLEKDGYYPMYVKEPVKAPVYQRIGPDLVSETMPVTIHDNRELHYVLQPIASADEVVDIVDRCEEMVARSEPLLERRRAYDAQRTETDIPFLPEKKKRDRRAGRNRPALTPQEARQAKPLQEMPPLAPLQDAKQP